MTATEIETPRTDKAQRDQRTGRLLPAAVAVAGSDGTIVPVAGLFAPVAGTVATGFACLAAAWLAVSERRL
jgi:hypothetical protein